MSSAATKTAYDSAMVELQRDVARLRAEVSNSESKRTAAEQRIMRLESENQQLRGMVAQLENQER